MYRWECRPDRRRPTRTTVLGAPRPGAARGPRCRAMRYHHAADSYVYTNHAPWHVTRRGTLGPGSRASTSTPPPWWGNENHGLTLRVCPPLSRTYPGNNIHAADTVTRRINSIQPALIPPQERIVKMRTRPFVKD